LASACKTGYVQGKQTMTTTTQLLERAVELATRGAFWAARAFAKMGTNAAPAAPVLMESSNQ
jgi:hypothetical protein